jgi:hypothetical protein
VEQKEGEQISVFASNDQSSTTAGTMYVVLPIHNGNPSCNFQRITPSTLQQYMSSVVAEERDGFFHGVTGLTSASTPVLQDGSLAFLSGNYTTLTTSEIRDTFTGTVIAGNGFDQCGKTPYTEFTYTPVQEEPNDVTYTFAYSSCSVLEVLNCATDGGTNPQFVVSIPLLTACTVVPVNNSDTVKTSKQALNYICCHSATTGLGVAHETIRNTFASLDYFAEPFHYITFRSSDGLSWPLLGNHWWIADGFFKMKCTWNSNSKELTSAYRTHLSSRAPICGEAVYYAIFGALVTRTDFKPTQLLGQCGPPRAHPYGLPPASCSSAPSGYHTRPTYHR